MSDHIEFRIKKAVMGPSEEKLSNFLKELSGVSPRAKSLWIISALLNQMERDAMALPNKMEVLARHGWGDSIDQLDDSQNASTEWSANKNSGNAAKKIVQDIIEKPGFDGLVHDQDIDAEDIGHVDDEGDGGQGVSIEIDPSLSAILGY